MSHKHSPFPKVQTGVPSHTMSFCLSILEDIRTPLSLAIHQELSSQKVNWSKVATVEFKPHSYTEIETFKRDYLASKLLSKYPNADLGIDRAKVALEKFRLSELRCQAVNETLEGMLRTGNSVAASVVFMARRKIADLLPELNWYDLAAGFGWGPGASTSKKRQNGDAAYKFGVTTDASVNMRPLLPLIQSWLDPWFPEIRIVPGGRGTTVPKDARGDRFIMIEPDLNCFVQKGLGMMLRKALHKVGLLIGSEKLNIDSRRSPLAGARPSRVEPRDILDLSEVGLRAFVKQIEFRNSSGVTAQTRNQELAREGSITGELATIDLSSASDSVALRLVEELLPQDYVRLIYMCRSPVCVMPDGEQVSLHKVSSMGNGFTFELETLIFWALARSYVDLMGDRERRVAVYGDDIILSSHSAEGFSEVLADLGFSLNLEKSFWHGPFRESCGKHYWSGTDVTPFYVRDELDSIPRLFWAANSLKEWARLPGWGLDGSVEPTYNLVKTWLPEWASDLVVPPSIGRDIGLWVDLDEAVSNRHVVRDYARFGGWLCRGLTSSTKAVKCDTTGRLLKSLFLLQQVGAVGDHADPMRQGPYKVQAPFVLRRREDGKEVAVKPSRYIRSQG